MTSGKLLRGINAWLDQKTDQGSRQLARRTSRRSFLGKLGAGIVGISALPLLPVERAFSADELGDPKSCGYWRYCAISGFLCSCCGGPASTCPPGSEPSAVSWIGTCRNPVDDKDYLISYKDCCGTATCRRCDCHRSEGEKPLYFPSRNSSLTWCFGTDTRAYHCSLGVVIGQAN